MTALSIGQTAAARLKIGVPSTIYGNTDENVVLLKAMIEQAAREIRDAFPWPQLQTEYTFTLSTGVASYRIPQDINQVLFETYWNRTTKYPLIGPVDPVKWQEYKSGLITRLPRQRFRVKGFSDTQLFIDPTPTASENGQTCVFEYCQNSTFRARTWVASTSWAGNSDCTYNGNRYSRGGTGAGSTGTTPPTHTSGTVSDGSFNWTFIDTGALLYAQDGQLRGIEKIYNDTDVCLFDEQMIIDGTVWRFKRETGLAFESLRKDSEDTIEKKKVALMGASPIMYNSRMLNSPAMIGPYNYPQMGYGE